MASRERSWRRASGGSAFRSFRRPGMGGSKAIVDPPIPKDFLFLWVGFYPSIYMGGLWHCFTDIMFFCLWENHDPPVGEIRELNFWTKQRGNMRLDKHEPCKVSQAKKTIACRIGYIQKGFLGSHKNKKDCRQLIVGLCRRNVVKPRATPNL